MANNYSVTSLTLHPKNKDLPLILGRLAKSILQLFMGGHCGDDSSLYVVDQDENGYQSDNSVFEMLVDEFELDDSNCIVFSDLVPQLTSKLSPKTLYSLMRLIGDVRVDSEDCVEIEELLACCFYEANTNFGSFYSETGYWCSKTRHGEFGGAGAFYSIEFDTITYSGQLAYLGNKPIDVAVTEYVLNQVTQLLSSIKDTSLRSSVIQQLHNLS